jgi:hypothetical protein
MESVARLVAIGIAYQDALALRRVAMTLHRWHELESGDGNDHGSWAIVRGHKTSTREMTDQGLNVRRDHFEHDDDGKPYLEHHHYLHGHGVDYVSHEKLPDREKGAQKRLGKLMARYPGFVAYVQGDPRGASLYVLRPSDVPADGKVDSVYSRGVAVYK